MNMSNVSKRSNSNFLPIVKFPNLLIEEEIQNYLNALATITSSSQLDLITIKTGNSLSFYHDSVDYSVDGEFLDEIEVMEYYSID
ncbi:14254_t:CDS:2 [Funneliformis caledonium]|uniref:14254_t:CDS:1 n=1 Tax=Funneliformis caledonium TaxID=1117310 RepID=A0A9N9B1G6_9GLOM|nr:14254_t:CDS:2 [Funneliformis caledonium]